MMDPTRPSPERMGNRMIPRRSSAPALPRACRILVLVTMLVATGGCAVTGGRDGARDGDHDGSRSRGSLSAATDEAAARAAGEEPDAVTARRERWEYEDVELPEPVMDGNELVPADDDIDFDYGDDEDDAGDGPNALESLLTDVLVGRETAGGPAVAATGRDGSGVTPILAGGPQLRLSRTRPAGDAMGDISTVTVAYVVRAAPRSAGVIGGFYGRPEKGTQPTVSEGVKRFTEFGLDVGGRGYLTSDHTLLGLYAMLGARLGVLHWSFAAPVTEDAIESDSLFFGTPYGGVGVAVLQTKLFHLGVSGEWGLRIMPRRTVEAFDNDLYPSRGEWRLNLEATLLF